VLEAPLVAARWYARAGNEADARRILGDAQVFYQRVLSEYPGTEAALFARIRLFAVLATRGEWREAIADMEAMFADPKFRAEDSGGRMAALGRLRIGEIYAEELQQPEEALRQVRLVLEGGAPAEILPGARIVEARILSLAGRPGEALTELDRVLKESPNDLDLCAQACYTRGAVYEASGDWERALSEYRNLIARYPRTGLGLAAPLEIAARYQRVGAREAGAAAIARAIEDYRRVIDLDPRAREALVARDYMATAYAAREDWDQAAAALGDIAQEAAGSLAGAEALWREAEIYRDKLDDLDEAEKRLREIMTSYPKTEVARRAEARLGELHRTGAP
jgi:tetratricopeptide (TPR) repeat protein